MRICGLRFGALSRRVSEVAKKSAAAGIKSRKPKASAAAAVPAKASAPSRAVGAGETKGMHLPLPVEMHAALATYAQAHGLTMREVALAAIEYATTGDIDQAIADRTADGRYRGSPGRPIKVRQN